MKHYYLIVDTETTQDQTVADFGAVIMDRQGTIAEQYGVLVHEHFATIPLYVNHNAPAEDFFSQQNARRRRDHYDTMLENGTRVIASPMAVNLWLARVQGSYNPVVTAYNLPFDWSKCRNTDIDLGIFQNSFCLMKLAKKTLGILSEYADFCEERNLITPTGRLSFKADTMAKFIMDRDTYPGSLADEPHTALEDARDYEAPILQRILKNRTQLELLEIAK